MKGNMKKGTSKAKLDNNKSEKKFQIAVNTNLAPQKSEKNLINRDNNLSVNSQIPGTSKSLNPKNSVSGQKIPSDNSSINNITTKVSTSKLNTNKEKKNTRKSNNFNLSDATNNKILIQNETIIKTDPNVSILTDKADKAKEVKEIKDNKEEELIDNEYKPKKLEERDPTINPEANKVEQKDSNNIKVVARFRPLNNFEAELLQGGTGSICCQFNEQDTTSVKIVSELSSHMPPYQLDRVFKCETTQEEMYEKVAKELVLDVVNGYNGTIFTYGQSGSGKTHTMYGADIYDDELKGIIPRAIDHIFQIVKDSPENITYQIKFSIIQIYKEVVYDLLSGEKDLKVKESPAKGIYVEGLSEFFIDNIENFMELLELSQKQRIVSGTNLNSQSSRSHTIFMLELTSTNNIKNITKKGQMNLVDLAGTEKISKSGAVGKTLEEGIKINLSLSALGNVIHALTENSSFIPYRDSKLTRILQESLGGNFKTTLLVACSPHSFHLEETISTLKFAQRAKTIKNKVKMNIKLSYDQLLKIIANYKDDIEKLNKNNEKLKNRIKALIASGNILNTNAEELFNMDEENNAFEDIDNITTTISTNENIDSNFNKVEINMSLKHELDEKNELINSLEQQIIDLKKEIKEVKTNLEEKEDLLSQNNGDLLRTINDKYSKIVEMRKTYNNFFNYNGDGSNSNRFNKWNENKKTIKTDMSEMSEDNDDKLSSNLQLQKAASNKEVLEELLNRKSSNNLFPTNANNAICNNKIFIEKCSELISKLNTKGIEILSQENLEKLNNNFINVVGNTSKEYLVNFNDALLENKALSGKIINELLEKEKTLLSSNNTRNTSDKNNINIENNGMFYSFNNSSSNNNDYNVTATNILIKQKLAYDITSAFNIAIVNQNKILSEESLSLIQIIEDLTDINNNLINRTLNENEINNQGNMISSFIQGNNNPSPKSKKFNLYKGFRNFLTKSILGRQDDNTLGGNKVAKFVDKKTLQVNDLARRQSIANEDEIISDYMNENQQNTEFNIIKKAEDAANFESPDVNAKKKVNIVNKLFNKKKNNEEDLQQVKPNLFKCSIDKNDPNDNSDNSNIKKAHFNIVTPEIPKIEGRNSSEYKNLESGNKNNEIKEFRLFSNDNKEHKEDNVGNTQGTGLLSSVDMRYNSSMSLKKLEKSNTFKHSNLFRSILRKKNSNMNLYLWEDPENNKEIEERMIKDENLQYLLKAINSHKENFNALKEFIKKSFNETEKIKTIYEDLKNEIFTNGEFKQINYNHSNTANFGNMNNSSASVYSNRDNSNNSVNTNTNSNTKTEFKSHQPKQTKINNSNANNNNSTSLNNFMINTTNSNNSILSNSNSIVALNNLNTNIPNTNNNSNNYNISLEKIDEDSESSSEKENVIKGKSRKSVIKKLLPESMSLFQEENKISSFPFQTLSKK